MPTKIILSDETLSEIKRLYLSSLSSTNIEKILNIPKPRVLRALKELNILRNRFISEEFYTNFWFENDMWWGYWKCNECDTDVKFSVEKKSLLNRNLKKKNICKKCSLLKQVGEGNSFYGKKHSKSSIDKISLKKKGVSTSDHMSTPEYRKLFSDMTTERWASGRMEDVRIKMSNFLKQRWASGELKGYNRSKAEDEIIFQLRNIGIETIPNYLIGSKIFDIYIPKYNLLIEYNGDYWHCNPIKYKPDYLNQKKNKTAKELWDYDTEKLYLAKQNGYNTMVIWEADYKKNKNIVLDLIKNYNKI